MNIWLIIGAIIYSLITTYIFIYRDIKGNVSIKEKLVASFLSFLLTIMLLSVFIKYTNSVQNTIFLVSVYVLFLVIFPIFTNMFKQITRYNFIIIPIRLLILVIYIPISLLMYFKFEHTWIMILLTTLIVLFIIVPAFYFEKQRLQDKRNHIFNISNIYRVLLVLFALILFILFRTGVNTIHVLELPQGYQSTNQYVINDSSEHYNLLDFYVTNQYTYYLINSSDDNTLKLKVFDNNSQNIIREFDVSGGITASFEGNRFNHDGRFFYVNSDNNLTLFLENNIYIMDGTNITKIADFALENVWIFHSNGSLLFATQKSDYLYQIYEVTSNGIVLHDVLDFTDQNFLTYLSVVQDHLIITNQSATLVNVYGSNTYTIPFSSDNFIKVELIHNDNIVVMNYDNGNTNYPHYRIYKDGTIDQLKIKGDVANTLEQYGDIYYRQLTTNKTVSILDDNLNTISSFRPIFLTSNALVDGYSVNRFYGNNMYYALFSNADSNGLYIEINKLSDQNTSFYINPFLVYNEIVLLLGLTILVFPVSIEKNDH